MEIGVCYYPEHWPEEMWPDDASRMVASGISRVRIAEFAWSRIEPHRGDFHWDWLDRAIDELADAGLEITMCTPTATPPKWLIDETPEILAWDQDGRPRRFGSRRHYCFSSPVYREESARITEAVVSRYAGHPAVTSWQTDNEYGCHDTVESYSPAAVATFRLWLEDKYAGIDALNRAWGTVFWSQEYTGFDQIDLPNMTVTEPNPSHVLDFRRFSSDQVIAFNRTQVEIIRAHTSAAITHNVMGHFTAFDHYKLGRDIDITTWDSYPLGFLDQGWWSPAQKARWMRTGHPDFAAFHHSLYRSCSGGRWGVMEQQPGSVNWAPHNPAPLPGMVKLWMLETAAFGAEYSSIFRWRQAQFAQEQNHAGLFMSDNRPARGLSEVEAAASVLKTLGPLTPAPNPVALIFDYESQWIFDTQPQGAAWHYEKLCFLFYTTLRRLGVGVDIISPDHDLTPYRCAVVPSLPILPDGFLDRAKAADAHILFGPRSGSKTPDFHNAAADILPGLSLDGAESLPPAHRIDVKMDEGFHQGFIWRDFLSGPLAENGSAAECADGYPAFIDGPDYSYLAIWPEAKLLRAVLRQICERLNIGTLWLPKDVRVQMTQSHVTQTPVSQGHVNQGYGFAFNYGTRMQTLPEALGAQDFLIGGAEMPPASVSIWRL